MKAFILAAGKGIRLLPLTKKVPKPMLKVSGRPILEYTLSVLPDNVSEIFIVIGWLGDQIENYFGNKFGGRKITYIQQKELKGTYHALNSGKEFLKDEPFWALNADDIYSKDDLEKVNKHESAILAHHTEFPERFGICKSDADNNLITIIEKPKEFVGNLANIGVYKLRPSIFNEDPIVGSNGEQILAPMIGNLAQKENIKIVEATFWHPIGNIDDLNRAQKINLADIKIK